MINSIHIKDSYECIKLKKNVYVYDFYRPMWKKVDT